MPAAREPGRAPRLPFFRCVLPAIAILAVAYFNVSALMHSCGLRWRLPAPWYVVGTFDVFPVFGFYVETNYGFEAHGRLARIEEGSADREWVEIDLTQYFPQGVGESNLRLFLFSLRFDPDRKKRVYSELAGRLRGLYNRAHPDAPIDRVQIYQLDWPKSDTGYWAEFESRRYTVLVDE